MSSRAIRAGARRVLPDGNGMAGVLAGARTFALEGPPVRARAVDVVPPRVLAPVGAAGRLLPFHLGREATTGELAIGLRVVPVDAGNGDFGLGTIGGGRLGGRLATTGGHAGGVVGAGDLGAIDDERFDGRLAHRPLVLLAARAPLGEWPSRNGHAIVHRAIRARGRQRGSLPR